MSVHVDMLLKEKLENNILSFVPVSVLIFDQCPSKSNFPGIPFHCGQCGSARVTWPMGDGIPTGPADLFVQCVSKVNADFSKSGP